MVDSGRVAAWRRERAAHVDTRLQAANATVVKVCALLLAAATVLVLVGLTRGDVESYDSLADMYEPMGSAGFDCAPPPPVHVDPRTGRQRVYCFDADGAVARLELSDSFDGAEQAVADAHAGSDGANEYARVSGSPPVSRWPVLLGGNWVVVGPHRALEQVADELGGTIYPYPETP